MENITLIKTSIISVIAIISSTLGVFFPLFICLFLAMIFDYITGMTRAMVEKKLNSRTGIFGIIKKLLYGVVVAIALITDQLILILATQIGFKVPIVCALGIISIIWLTLNELISILENLGKLGVPLPKFLASTILILKKEVEKEDTK